MVFKSDSGSCYVCEESADNGEVYGELDVSDDVEIDYHIRDGVTVLMVAHVCCGCWFFFFFSSRRRHTRYWRDWSSDVCSSDLWLSASTVAGRWPRRPPGSACRPGRSSRGRTTRCARCGSCWRKWG